MDIKKLKVQNKRLEAYLNIISRSKSNLHDVVRKIEIEDSKDYLNQYLLTPRSWYEDRETYLSNLIIWSEKRIIVIIKNMNYATTSN